LKWVYNSFFEAKKALYRKMNLWPEQSDISFRATSGTPQLNGFRIQQGESPIDALYENSFSNSQRIGIGICSGSIKRWNPEGENHLLFKKENV